jgi:predicted nucleotide-binding protein (sugar kinase/HSP70/actin superfamily)
MTTRLVLIPNMCDHSFVIEAVFEHFGIAAEVMPPSDEESAALGVDLVLGKECTPCAYVVGDVIRRLRRPDIDPRRTALMMASAGGPCRFGQYHVLLRHILDEQGFGEVEIIYPTADNAYKGFGDDPAAFRSLAWRGVVAVDLLQALLHSHRPYEQQRGETDRLYQEALARLLAAVRQGGKSLVRVMQWIGGGFRRLPVERLEPRPRIGVVGEIFVRQHQSSNRNVVRQIEALGGEVLLANMMEFFYAVNWGYIQKCRQEGNWREIIGMWISDAYQRYWEFRLSQPIADLLHHRFEARSAQIMRYTATYMDLAISTEAILTVGKAVELAHQGASGILNVLPFTCMPGIITAGLAPRIRQDLNGIPWLDLSYDMQQGTNLQTRLEAFMHQAVQYQRRRDLLQSSTGAAAPR